jgi:hypothetical protein
VSDPDEALAAVELTGSEQLHLKFYVVGGGAPTELDIDVGWDSDVADDDRQREFEAKLDAEAEICRGND